MKTADYPTICFPIGRHHNKMLLYVHKFRFNCGDISVTFLICSSLKCTVMESRYTDQSHQCTLYPGDYFPVLTEQELSRALIQSKKVNTVAPSVNFSEEQDHFRVEAAIPGLHREDFFISIDEDVLSIAVLHKQQPSDQQKCFQLQEFEFDCFNRKLTLPQNAETSFVQAEYKDGILNMYIPKTALPTRQAHTQVVVY